MAADSITHLRHVGLAVQDIPRASAFYCDLWGLVPSHTDRDVAFLAAEGSPEQYVLRLRENDNDQVDVLAFAVANTRNVDNYCDQVRAHGGQVVHEPRALDTPGGGYGFRFVSPDGFTFEISCDVAARHARRVTEREAIPVRLSHVVLNTTALEPAVKFFVEVLGFQVSDWLADVMCFLRCGTDHHTIALSASSNVSLNHVAYEMVGLDEYMRASGRLIRAGHELIWGPGRHGPGDNTFSYFQDAAGFLAEFTTELEQIPENGSRPPRIYPLAPEVSDQWGTANSRPAEPFYGRPDPGLWHPPPF